MGLDFDPDTEEPIEDDEEEDAHQKASSSLLLKQFDLFFQLFYAISNILW